MSTPQFSLKDLPPDLLKVIDQYVAEQVSRLAQEAQLANAPKELTPREKLKDHLVRAVSASLGDTSASQQSTLLFHILQVLAFIIQEIEAITAPSDTSSPVVPQTPASTTAVVDGSAI